ncbi:MAG: SIS domain-containing protein [Rickettsiales bacterium]|jgi:glucosamine 6-phosphate synthetase-like amidotransferase/phosphosugar isomerase protein|nr:SIS domain-containing protein [Rickettsiales bacterium]
MNNEKELSTVNDDIYKYILEADDYVKSITANAADITKDAAELYKNNKIEQIYLLGAGTSLHAHISSKLFMEKMLKIPIYCEDAMLFNSYTTIYNKNTLVITSSHGGRSRSSIDALIKARESGCKTISSTAVLDSEITKYSDKILYCKIGEEYAGPKTKGYICAIVTNMVLSLEIANPINKQEYLDRILKTSANIKYIAEETKKWYAKHKDELLKSRRLVLIGYAQNIGNYMEGTLKLLESVRYSVTGYELENFMHGIYHSIWKDDYMFYLGSKGKYYENMLKMKKYFDEERRNHNFIFTGDKTQDDGKNFIANFIDDEDFCCLEYIVPIYVLVYLLSTDLGINASIPSDPDFHRKMGSYKF